MTEVDSTRMTGASRNGFTLAELLISLAILGIIATFTIPKIIGASTGSQNRAVAKEAASMVAGAYSTFKKDNVVTAAITPGALTSYMSYAKLDTSASFVANTAGETNLSTCSATLHCLFLHSGGVLQYSATNSFGATNATNYITFAIDPDGVNRSAGSATILLYLNGRVTTGSQASGSTTGGLTIISSEPDWMESWN